MVCDKDPYLHLATSLIFVSWAIGAIVLGWLSDRFHFPLLYNDFDINPTIYFSMQFKHFLENGAGL